MGKINLGIIELTQATEVSSVSGNVDTLSGITVAHTGDTNIHVTSAEKSKLAGVEAGAQKHIAPTASEVKTALGTTTGTTKYLREDGTWQTPEGEDMTHVAYLEDASQEATVAGFDPQADTVHVTAQSLTSAQKAQARTNIDAIDSSALNGFATQTWVQNQNYDKKVDVVAASGTALNVEVGKYYRFDSAVSQLAVILPAITNTTTIQGCMFYLTTSSTISLTFTGGGTVRYHDGYEIKENSTYEINAIWNGAVWVIASIKIF